MRASLLLTGLAAVLVKIAAAQDSHPDCKNGPLSTNKICDPSANTVDRAEALISLFTVEEKLNQTGHIAPGVPRLGLPPYNWWQEALHGVASGHGITFSPKGEFSHATSFPQPILMGAAFDDELINAVATVVGTEGRAFNNANRGGLDFWTPNINGFKDPRWGRGQEVPSEDVFHLTSYVSSLIDGLQGGSDQKYKRVVATCKHFAGYDMENWNGNERYQFDAQISMQDLAEYYMPAFKACVKADVGAFMCAYNAVNGVPSCSNEYLIEDVLRGHWGWTNNQQWVVSDCDAIQNVFLPHAYKPTRAEAVAASLKSGVDLNCGTYFQLYLPDAYKQGLITDDDVDQALVRLYSSLIQLGYFDPDEDQPYRSLGWKDVNTEEGQLLAYQAAVEGITLLKNDGTLPIDIKGKTVAVFGDWANATTQMQGNYAGIAPYLISPLMAAENITTTNFVKGGDVAKIIDAAEKSDVIVYVSGIDNSDEDESLDRGNTGWAYAELDIIERLSEQGKPMIIVQMGGGQIDETPFKNSPNINAILWAGYPGQSGGTAIFDIITGIVAPAGRLPITQYPAEYVSQVPMTEMALRPSGRSPGRTYKWYNGEPVYPFAYGLHYTSFNASLPKANASTPNSLNKRYNIADLVKSCNSSSSPRTFIEDCPFTTVNVDIENTGAIASDYVTLLFLGGKFGPKPYPNKSLVAYKRAHNITAGATKSVALNLTLGSLARVDKNGNMVLYPGDYSLMVDIESKLTINFSLHGGQAILDKWPQPKNVDKADPPNWIELKYFAAGYGSEGVIEHN
ncbi:hypothetical protein O988_03192 [Pseudogymnoascus sp. VKM F-3808]|nr:hypothetical protein O988_03192 [Pseudogymnoascus sp. VKM F-3808]